MAQVQEWNTSKPSAHLKVILLVANDDATMRSLAHVLSQELHSQLFVAPNGFAAVKFVRHITPHLLIVDDCLPDMTAIQLYDRLHANRELATLPAIMLSASLEDVKDALAARNLMGVSKPFDLDELITTIETIFAPLLSSFKSLLVILSVRSIVSGGQNDVLHLWMQKALRYDGRCKKHCGKVF